MVRLRKIMTQERGSLLITVTVFVAIGSVLIMGLTQNFFWMRRSLEARYGALKVTYLAISGLALSRQFFSSLPTMTPTGPPKVYLYDHLQGMWRYDANMDGIVFLARTNDLIYIVAASGHYRAAFQVKYTVSDDGTMGLLLPERL